MPNSARVIHSKISAKKGVEFSTMAVPIADIDVPRNNNQQTYLDRVRNYIPVEVIAFFIFANSMVSKEKLRIPETNSIAIDGYVAVASIVVGIIASVLFVRSSASAAQKSTWGVQAVMSVIAFLIWVYALDAKAFQLFSSNFQSAALSGFLLATFTLFSGLVIPRAHESNQQVVDAKV